MAGVKLWTGHADLAVMTRNRLAGALDRPLNAARVATRLQLIGLTLAFGVVAASWAALFFFGLGWGRQDLVFEASSPMCRNIATRVDGQLWHSPDGAVPYDVDHYELSFEAAGEIGVLVLTSRVDDSEVRLWYQRGRGDLVPLPCRSR